MEHTDNYYYVLAQATEQDSFVGWVVAKYKDRRDANALARTLNDIVDKYELDYQQSKLELIKVTEQAVYDDLHDSKWAITYFVNDEPQLFYV